MPSLVSQMRRSWKVPATKDRTLEDIQEDLVRDSEDVGHRPGAAA